jgi:hypothetical protein
MWLNRPGPVKIVAGAAFGACLGWVAGLFEPLAPASALPALAKKALSLALRALIARRRHSSARRRKCSILNCFLPADRPASLLCPVGTQQLYLIFGSRSLKLFARLRAHRAATIIKECLGLACHTMLHGYTAKLRFAGWHWGPLWINSLSTGLRLPAHRFRFRGLLGSLRVMTLPLALTSLSNLVGLLFGRELLPFACPS